MQNIIFVTLHLWNILLIKILPPCWTRFIGILMHIDYIIVSLVPASSYSETTYNHQTCSCTAFPLAPYKLSIAHRFFLLVSFVAHFFMGLRELT